MTASLGCAKADLDTPALCLDLDLLESNIARVSGWMRDHRVAWRPHCKGHKVPAIARLQLAAGAIGVTCAKLGEAEVMAAGGVRDLLIANLVVGPRKIERLVALRRVADPIVCVDHFDQARPLSDAFAATGLRLRVLIEVDVGLHRVGVAPGEAALALAQAILALPGLEFAGLMGYEGHLLTIEDAAEKQRAIHQDLGQLIATRDLLAARGIACGIISVGGTGSYQITAAMPGVTELQAGGAVYMDAFYRHRCGVVGLDYAMTVLTTVVARPAANRAIIDAGRKTINIEIFTPEVHNRPDLKVVRLSAEHGQLEVSPDGPGLRIGDRLELVPGYGDLTTCLHDHFLGFRAGRLEVVWPIEARGKLQ